MSNPNKPSFSDRTLFAAESAQYILHRFKTGRQVISKFTGSDYPAYEQLLWLPPWKIKSVDVRQCVRVPGDPNAKESARDWDRATVLAASILSMEALESTDESIREAVAYRSSKAWHVGVSAVGGTILSPDEKSRLSIAMREGSGGVSLTLGGYSYDKREFQSIGRGLELVAVHVPLDRLPTEHPGIKLG